MKYSVVLADPPWWYADRLGGKGRTVFGSGAGGKYDLLKAHEVVDPNITLPIKDMVTEDAVLFLWCTMPLLYDSERRNPEWKPDKKFKAPHDALTVMQGWGFRYATTVFTWVKTNKTRSKVIYGPGKYTASNVEVVLLGVRGKMPPERKMTPSVIHHPRMEHSRKPNIHKLIDQMYPEGERIELFARRLYNSHWDYWGNEVGKEATG